MQLPGTAGPLTHGILRGSNGGVRGKLDAHGLNFSSTLSVKLSSHIRDDTLGRTGPANPHLEELLPHHLRVLRLHWSYELEVRRQVNGVQEPECLPSEVSQGKQVDTKALGEVTRLPNPTRQMRCVRRLLEPIADIAPVV